MRGRALAEFIDKTKGEKWQALSELLGLETIDRLRLDLQRARNDLSGQAESARGELSQRESALLQWVNEVSKEGILKAIGAKCGVANIQAPSSFERALDPQWRETIALQGSGDRKAAALRAALEELSEATERAMPLDPIHAWNQFITEGQQDQLPLGLYRAADTLMRSGRAQADICPLCHQPLSLDQLAERLSNDLDELEEAARELGKARQAARQFVASLRDGQSTRTNLVSRVASHGLELATLPDGRHEDLHRSVEEISPMERSSVERYRDDMAAWDIAACEAIASEIPAPATEHEQALIELGSLLTSAAAWRLAALKHSEKSAAFNLADRLFAEYQERQGQYFSQVIQLISRRVAEIYQFLHPEGGIGQVAIETVGDKGAELWVEFHGRKELPPHRVLSESHLNSLGIALFLAMTEAFNENLAFLVLDDVVNSMDREHRGRLADLLVEEFSDAQLIILTHDEQFFTRIHLRAPSWKRLEFASWSYEQGPRTIQYEGDRLLVAAHDALATDDRTGAAQKGRRALEELLQEACERLEALLPFRRGHLNEQRMAGEVMAGLRRTLRDDAKSRYAETRPLLDALEADLQATLNVESHANQGGASSQEVRDALQRISDLRECFTCPSCETRVWHVGSSPSWRCKCGQSVFPPPTNQP